MGRWWQPTCGPSVLLKLDIDAGMPFPSNKRIDLLLARAGYRRDGITRRRSPGGAGWHVVVSVLPTPASPLEVVALQAILGSDPLREACNLNRAQRYETASPFWRARWNVLYQ